MALRLVIDTSLNACGLGLFDSETCLFDITEGMTRGQQERLPVMALEAADTNGQTDAFVSDASGNAVRISQGEAGAQSSQPSFAPQISGDGQTVAFVSAARELDPDVADGGTSQDLHVGTLRGGRVRNLSRLDAERSGQVASRNVRRPTLNYAGNKLMYDSSGGNLATAAPLEELRVFQQANPVNPDRIFGAGFD